MNKNQLITENNGYEQKEYTPNNNAKKLIASILAVTAGVSAVAVTSAVVFHDIFFRATNALIIIFILGNIATIG